MKGANWYGTAVGGGTRIMGLVLLWVIFAAFSEGAVYGVTPTFSPVTGSPFQAGIGARYAQMGDLNGDGKPDLVVANTETNTFTIHLGDGGGGFTEAANSPIAVNGLAVKELIDYTSRQFGLADLNGDGHLDIASGGTNGVVVLLNNGTGTFGPASGSPFDAGGTVHFYANHPKWAYFTFAADMNSDGRPDLVCATGERGRQVSILLGDGTGGFTCSSGTPYDCTTNHNGVSVSDGTLRVMKMGDFNADGIPDFALLFWVQNPYQYELVIWLGDGAGGLVPAPYSPMNGISQISTMAAGDFNGDGYDDMVLAKDSGMGNQGIYARMSDGMGGFVLRQFPPSDNMHSFWKDMAAGDFNGDGVEDLVAMSDDTGCWVWAGDRTGNFVEVGKVFQPTTSRFPTYVSVGDATGDGKPDITIALPTDGWHTPPAQWANKVSVLRNTTSVSFAPMIEPPFLAGGLVGQAFSYTIKASGTAPITYTATPLPSGLSLNGNVISGTPTQVGQTRATLTANNAVGSDTNILTVTITDPSNRAPVISAGPFASPNPAGVGRPVTFSATCADPDGDPLTYLWRFGDGTSSTAANPTHSFATNQQFLVSLEVRDGKAAMATASVKVTVSDARPGDLNMDGVVNEDDVSLVTSHRGQTSANPNWDARADANGDGVVSDADLATVKAAFGTKYQ
ncbi:MAG: hypothetical protein C0404_04400 [Verrucomicrobia bacterium]|nr:hypothetical protein [Verrucomicrobiota bacterium]